MFNAAQHQDAIIDRISQLRCTTSCPQCRSVSIDTDLECDAKGRDLYTGVCLECEHSWVIEVLDDAPASYAPSGWLRA